MILLIETRSFKSLESLNLVYRDFENACSIIHKVCIVASLFYFNKIFWSNQLQKMEVSCVVDGSYKKINHSISQAGLGGIIFINGGEEI